MKLFSFDRLITNPLTTSLQASLAKGVSAFQHMLMKAAVAASLKLCIFTARVLLNSSPASHGRTSQSF